MGYYTNTIFPYQNANFFGSSVSIALTLPQYNAGIKDGLVATSLKLAERAGLGHTVTITSQKQNHANISGSAGPILENFLVQNLYKLIIFLP